MANKRMFSNDVIDSDLFLDMPLSSQALYFHLCMKADDDGFVGNSKRIIRMINACEDDLNILIIKKFVIRFESGIIVVRHWKINNYIQKDRYKYTIYLYEKSLVLLNNSGVYELKEIVSKVDANCTPTVRKVETSCTPTVCHMETSCTPRLEQISIDKISIEQQQHKCVQDVYNEKTVVVVENTEIIENIQKKIECLIGNINKSDIKKIILKHGTEKVNYYLDNFSKFNATKNPMGFFIKAIENNWDIPKVSKINYNPEQSNNFDQREIDPDELELFENMYIMGEKEKETKISEYLSKKGYSDI